MKDEFSKEKNDFLNKKDKSTKGSWDKEILDLLNFINSVDCFYTTSSCSGRIVLITEQDKKESEWLFVSHAPVEQPIKIEKQCWFLQESPIIHIRCKDLEDASVLLNIAHKSGLKKSGVISLENITVEIRGSERIECPISPELCSEYVSLLVAEGNKKLIKSRKIFDRFFENLKLEFK